MSNVRVLLCLTGAAMLVLAVACGGGKKSSGGGDQGGVIIATQPAGGGSSSGGAGTPAAGAASSSAGGQGSGELGAIADAYGRAKSYRATVSIEGPGAPKQDVKLEVVLPDKYHITFSSAVPGAPGIEVIQIGSSSYYKTGASWTRQSGSGAGSLFDAKTLNSSVQSLRSSGATRGGTANVGGKTCQLYTYTLSGAAQEMCVADNLPLRIVSTVGTTKTTVVFTDWNANIEVKAPV